MSAVFEFLVEIFRFIVGIFSEKSDNRKDLWPEIVAKRSQLVKALEEGRVSDVAILRKELETLMRQYRHGVRILERSMRRARRDGAVVFALVATSVSIMLSLLQGCKSRPPQTVLVSGDRIHVMNPGDEMRVPDLIPPAKKWYLLDNIAIQGWLGIPVDFDVKSVSVEVDGAKATDDPEDSE